VCGTCCLLPLARATQIEEATGPTSTASQTSKVWPLRGQVLLVTSPAPQEVGLHCIGKWLSFPQGMGKREHQAFVGTLDSNSDICDLWLLPPGLITSIFKNQS
jgi:hypothetical protein